MINKFSFGISLNIKLDEYEELLKEYHKYIKSVYFSLPYGDEFHTRYSVIEEYNQINSSDKLYAILNLFKKWNINLELLLNQYNIPEVKCRDGIKRVKDIIEIDSICTLDEYIPIIDEVYPEIYLICSYNNNIKNIMDIKNINNRYNEIVLGSTFFRRPDLLDMVKEFRYDTKLLLNNGCSVNCYSCRYGAKKCREVFLNNLKTKNIEQLYALQSFFPMELEKLVKLTKHNITELKISNRPCTYKYLRNCLESYIKNVDEKKYIKENINNYHLWCRLNHFCDYYDEFNLERIIDIKNTFWKSKE